MKKFSARWLPLFCGAALAAGLGSCSKSPKYADGTYTGTAEGRNGDVTVSVTVSGGKITAASVTGHEETEGIADPAITEIPARIVKAQSARVDAVSGATITSKAIMQAAEKALANAGGSASASGTAQKARKNVAVKYKAGTYSGTGQGMNGPVVLDVTFSDSAITT